MPIRVGTLLVEVAANVARIQSDMGKAAHIVTTTQRRIDRAAKAMGFSLAGAFTIYGIKRFIGGAIDSQESLDKLSQKIGESAAWLSRFDYAAKKSGTDLEVARTGFQRFARSIAAAGGPPKETSDALAALGISARDSAGKIKPMRVLLDEVADAFRGMRDGPEKTAAAMVLFGRSGAELIPTLNNGSKGLKALGDEAERLGVVIDDQAAKAAADFKDELLKLESQARGLGLTLARVLVPGLTNVVTALDQGSKHGAIRSSLLAIGAAFTEQGALLAEAMRGGPLEVIRLVDSELKRLRGEIRDTSAKLNTSFPTFGPSAKDQLDKYLATYRKYSALKQRLIDALKAEGEEERKLQRQRMESQKQAKARMDALAAEAAAKKKAAEEAKKAERERQKAEQEAEKARKKALAERLKAEKDAAQKLSGIWNDQAQERERALQGHYDRLTSAARGYADDAGRAFATLALTGKSSFRDMAQSIIGDMIRIQMVRNVFGPLANAIMGGGRQAGITPYGQRMGFQDAGSGISMTPAKGASGMVLTRPTRLAGGAAIGGEAGPEGVLPLTRTRSGDLGVRASGGGTVVQIFDQRGSGAALSARRSTGASGQEMIRIMVRDAVQADLADGAFDRAMSANFGLRRAGTRR